MIGMENDNKPVSQDNWGQIIRKDAKGCFVEVRNDTFHLDKVHLQFVSYDTTKPKGSRYVNNISIYIDVPEAASWPWPRRPPPARSTCGCSSIRMPAIRIPCMSIWAAPQPSI